MSSQERQEADDEFIAESQGEVVAADDGGAEPMSDDDEEPLPEGEEAAKHTIEIDLSNNSYAYFDGHYREEEDSSVTLIATHPKLPMVLTGGLDDTAYLWTTHKSEVTTVARLTGHTESVVAGGFTASGDYVVTGDMNGQIRIWKSAKKGEVWQFLDSVSEADEIVNIAFHPTQNIFAASASDGAVWVYAIEPSLENINVLNGHARAANAAVFVDTDDVDSLNIITASDDFTIIKWNAYLGTQLFKLGHPELYGEHAWVSAALSPTKRTVALGSSDGQLVIVGVENGNVLNRIDTGPSLALEDQGIEAIAWGTHAKLLAVGNVAGEIQLYDLATWKLRKTLKADASITKLEFIANSPFIVSSAYDGFVTKWNALSGEQVWQSQGHNVGVIGFVLQDGGKRIISGDDEGVSLVFNTEEAPKATQSMQLQ